MKGKSQNIHSSFAGKPTALQNEEFFKRIQYKAYKRCLRNIGFATACILIGAFMNLFVCIIGIGWFISSFYGILYNKLPKETIATLKAKNKC